MWVLTGPFDGELGADLSFQKNKLLKTGTSYPMGRKDRPLCIASKKVSHDHCEFVTGKYSADDVSNPLSKPSLEIINKKDKGMRLMREGVETVVNPMVTRDLQDGDIVYVVTGVPVRVTWHAVCCFSPKPSHSVDACASLGINLVHVLDPRVTHHLTPTYNTTPSIACSLITAAQFVKPEWLHEVIKLGNAENSGTSLEESFVLPPINKFRPTFVPSLSPAHKVFNIWEPNEERLHMFNDFRFICVGEKPKELDSDMRELIHRAGGTLDVFEVHGGVTKFHRALARGQAKEGNKKLILVADSKAMVTAIGQDEWKEFLMKAKSFGLFFVNPDVVIQAILDVDVTVFDRAPAADKDDMPTRSVSPPSFISNTLADEPSQLSQLLLSQPTRQKLKRRVTSRQPSVEPIASQTTKDDDVVEVEAPKPRRALTRRINAGKPMVTGLDDPSIILDAVPEIPVARESSPPTRPLINLTAPTPARSNRLKRRIVGVAPQDAPASLGTQVIPTTFEDISEEPPLKKFKALFDESDPDRIIMESPQESNPFGGSSTQTQTQSGSQSLPPRTFTTSTSLSLLREEEEESQSLANLSGGTKRRLDTVDEDMQIDDPGNVRLDTAGVSKPASKRRAVENLNAVEKVGPSEPPPRSARAASKPPQSAVKASGALPGKPDKDAAFLKAIASTKRGKKSEDHFDREFNNLKISKPDLACEEQEDEWNVLAEFGDDTGIRGNFMTIVEMKIFREGTNRRNGPSNASQWEGKPNFKKFKKTDTERSHRRKIELIPIGGDSDDKMENSYWKDESSQSQMQSGFSKEYRPTQTQPQISPRKPSTILEDDSNDEEVVPRRVRSKPPSKTAPAAKQTSARKNAPTKASMPLFLDSDEDIKEDNDDMIIEDDESQTLRSSNGKTSQKKKQQSTAATKSKKAKAVVVEDDSDDEAVFKGFTKKATRSRGR